MSSYSDADSYDEELNSNNKRSKHRKDKQRLKKKRPQLFDNEVEESDYDESSLDEEARKKHNAQFIKEEMQYKNSKKYSQRPQFLRENMDDDEIQDMYDQKDQMGQNEYDDDNFDQADMQNLLPSKSGPKIFSVEVLRKGCEQEYVLQILNKFKHVRGKDASFRIKSVSAIESQEGLIFIEAYKRIDIMDALRGLDGIKLMSTTLVSDVDIPKIFTVQEKKEYNIQNSQYVLIKQGCCMPYSLDIAKVKQVKDNNKVTLTVVQRGGDDHSYNKKAGATFDMGEGDKSFKGRYQRPKYTMDNRPERDTGKIMTLNNVHCRNLVTDFDLTQYKQELLDLEQETDFATLFENNKQSLLISQSLKSRFKVGDLIEIKNGDFTGIKARIHEILGNQVKVKPLTKALKDEVLEFQFKDIKKFFKEGEHIQVINGKYLGTTGKISSIDKQTQIAKITTDNDNNITVKIDDLTKSEARNVQVIKTIDNLERLDLIKLTGYNGIGIVLKFSGDYLTVLNTNNQVQNVNKIEYDSKIDTRRNTFKTHRHDLIQSGSLVTILDGYYKGIKAQIKHIYKDQCFLFSSDFNNQHDNIVVENGNNLQVQSRVITQQRSKAVFNDRQKVTNEQLLDNGDQRQIQKKNDDTSILGSSKLIKGGQYKGLYGIIKGIFGEKYKVEIPSKMKTVNIDKQLITPGNQSSVISGQTPSRDPQSVHYYAQSPSYGVMQSPYHSRQTKF